VLAGTGNFSENVDGIYVKGIVENNWKNITNDGSEIVWNDYNSDRQIEFEQYDDLVTVQLKGRYTIEGKKNPNANSNSVIAYSNGDSLLNGWTCVDGMFAFDRWIYGCYSIL
jgi:hypothetical protein